MSDQPQRQAFELLGAERCVQCDSFLSPDNPARGDLVRKPGHYVPNDRNRWAKLCTKCDARIYALLTIPLAEEKQG